MHMSTTHMWEREQKINTEIRGHQSRASPEGKPVGLCLEPCSALACPGPALAWTHRTCLTLFHPATAPHPVSELYFQQLLGQSLYHQVCHMC